MALITIPKAKQTLTDAGAIAAFLKPYGIHYERWPVEGRIDRDATGEEILAAYAPEVEQVKQRGGYVTADVINVSPETPNLDAMLNRFNKEHTHSEDEVRFIVRGRGLFHIHPKNGDDVFAIEVEAGDMINVPAGTQHWFDLCGDRTIRAIRLFRDMSGWSPAYIESGAHAEFIPVCMGPAFVQGGARVALSAEIGPAMARRVEGGVGTEHAG